MSGTSLDGIDAALVSFDNNHARLLCTHETDFPDNLRNRLQDLINDPDHVSLDHLGQVDRELGRAYASAVAKLLAAAEIKAGEVTAIGCHGQTIRHMPEGKAPFTLQIGDAAILAAETGIPVVNDFRSGDMAVGGQGAPLAPAFHQFAFATDDCERAIINIGGIANITVLRPDSEVTGYDTGPGNTLLDQWCNRHLAKPYDNNGAWAAEGEINDSLLDSLLADAYFSQPPPKSTGREYFNNDWLLRHLSSNPGTLRPADVQATLTELTARSIATAVTEQTAATEVYLCGGGANNAFLTSRIAAHLSGRKVAATNELGIAADWVEAAAFAWLARARLKNQPGNLPSVTGASRAILLGSITAP